MRKYLISLAAAGSALAFATPAAAQFFPGQPYGAPYGNAYGYNNYGQVRALQARINSVEFRINQLDRRNMIGDREADRLRREANRVERQLRYSARFGLNPYEANAIQQRISILEQRVQYASANRWNRGYGYNGYNGYNGYYGDRDNDNRWDRDHDRWHENHDGDRDDDNDDD